MYEGKATRAIWLAHACRLPYKENLVRLKDGRETLHQLRYGAIQVQLPEFNFPLTMVVVKGLGDRPMMLLASIGEKPEPKLLWFIIRAYIKRWSIEETIRFVKQTYDLENIRVLKYVRLQNMMALLLAVFYFVAVILDRAQKLTVMTGHVLKCAKRVFGIPDFKYYALGDGLSSIFKHFPGKIISPPIKKPNLQLSFGFG